MRHIDGALAGQGFGRVADELAEVAVDFLEAAIEVGERNADGRRLEDALEPQLTLAQRAFALGAVGDLALQGQRAFLDQRLHMLGTAGHQQQQRTHHRSGQQTDERESPTAARVCQCAGEVVDPHLPLPAAELQRQLDQRQRGAPQPARGTFSEYDAPRRCDVAKSASSA